MNYLRIFGHRAPPVHAATLSGNVETVANLLCSAYDTLDLECLYEGETLLECAITSKNIPMLILLTTAGCPDLDDALNRIVFLIKRDPINTAIYMEQLSIIVQAGVYIDPTVKWKAIKGVFHRLAKIEVTYSVVSLVTLVHRHINSNRSLYPLYLLNWILPKSLYTLSHCALIHRHVT